MKIRTTLLAVAALLPAASAQSSLLTWTGPQTNCAYATDVAGGGDVNGDGCDDVIVGARNYNNGALNDAGMVRVYSGYDGEFLIGLYGTATTQYFGDSVAFLGDINLDGHDDFVVGAPGDDTAGTNAGVAFVHSGKTGGKLFSFYGAAVQSSSGTHVACAGDINADGRPDIIVGSHYEDVLGPLMFDAGRARVYSGTNGALLLTLTGTSEGLHFGYSVDGAGDVDGDGRDDLVIGAVADPGLPGRVEVRSGVDGHTIFTRVGLVHTSYGFDVAGLGDVNADGFNDVAVGIPDIAGGGKVEVLLGPAGTLKWSFMGLDAASEFGTSIDGTGDIDKDGHDDVIVGGPGFGLERGMAQVFSGRTGGVLYATLVGDSDFDNFGSAVAGAGDTNGDGWLDVIVGAAENSLQDSNGYARTFDILATAPDIGFGGPGNAKLKMYGSPLTSFGEMDLSLKGAAPNKQGLLVASIGQMSIPWKGGILVPDLATASLVPFATSAQGKLLITGIPGGGGPVNVTMQCMVKDPAQPKGWALSNAIRPQFLP